MRKLLTLASLAGVTVVAAVFGGPVMSGAVLLLLPTGIEAVPHDLPPSYQPVHQGGVDLATGLYIREDEDLVVGGTPALILRRTYLSGDRAGRQFGVGTTHNGEIYLHGHLRQIALILAAGNRIVFDRTSVGGNYMNAMFDHSSNSEWDGSRLGWAGFGWALKRPDGELMLFSGCRPQSLCSVIQSRDADGHSIRYVRERSGRLTRMQSADRWIGFAYDSENRITNASASTGQSVSYTYDRKGRLSQATHSNGSIFRYGYTDRDEMALMQEPRRTIDNTYDANGRCIRQDVRYPGNPETLTFAFSFRLDGKDVVQTDMLRSDGPSSQHVFNANRSVVSESWADSHGEVGRVVYERDSLSDRPTGLAVTCPDRKGIPLRHIGVVNDGNAERVKHNLFSRHCFWLKSRPSAQPE